MAVVQNEKPAVEDVQPVIDEKIMVISFTAIRLFDSALIQ